MRILLLVILAPVTVGCSGARASIRADTAKYSISLSQGLRNPDGSLVTDDQKEAVGTFELGFKDWSFIWTLIPYHHEHDISDEVNAQVEKAGGNAITGLTIKASHCLWNLVTMYGLLPDCANVDIHGDIVKVTPRGAIRRKPREDASPGTM